MDYIIIQAGGLGSRMLSLTENKPKALIPFNNKPILFHLFSIFPKATFIIIGDYKFNILESYLKVFADVKYYTVNTLGRKGTNAGLKEALKLIPKNNPFLIIWSDIILGSKFKFPASDYNLVGLSDGFECRWSFNNNTFSEEKSNNGVAGFFYFLNKDILKSLPLEGEFVRWLSTTKILFHPLKLIGAQEIGTFAEWEKRNSFLTRPFNKIKISDSIVLKESITELGYKLLDNEKKWYKFSITNKFSNIPKIISYEPFMMSKIDGVNIYKLNSLSLESKKQLLFKIVTELKRFHQISFILSDELSFVDNYINKTFERINKIKTLVPFVDQPYITINNKVCRNIFLFKDLVINTVLQYFPKYFYSIHGDPTFSNIMYSDKKEVLFIDPRGYFGFKEIYGDIAYDWAKLFYSLKGNYDNFNQGRFKLKINNNSIEFLIDSSSWENLEEYFLELIGDQITRKQLTLYMALIWFGLTSYSWHNYDSILASFYIGSYYLEESLNYGKK